MPDSRESDALCQVLILRIYTEEVVGMSTDYLPSRDAVEIVDDVLGDGRVDA